MAAEEELGFVGEEGVGCGDEGAEGGEGGIVKGPKRAGGREGGKWEP